MISAFKNLFFILTSPLQDFLSWLGTELNPEPEMTTVKVDQILALVQPGDALFSYERHHPTNWLIPGDYDHAAIVAIYKNRLYVVEAIKPHVQMVPLQEWLFKKDNVALGRRKDKDSVWREGAGNWALTQVGSGYDTRFRNFQKKSKNYLRLRKTYCSKLVANALDIFFTGQIEPVQLMYHDKMELLINTKGV